MNRTRQRLEKIAGGFMEARILLSAVELDLFTALGNDSLSAADIAARTRTAEEPLSRLLNALVALKLMTKKRGLYRNSAAVRRHLVAGAPEYLGDIMRHRNSLWDSWSNLTEVVRTGSVPPRRRTRAREKSFIKGMGNIAAYSARHAVAALKPELAAARRLLDVGGGPATYACAFARARPELRVTVIDLPGPLTYARETIAEQGMQDRVTVRAGDARALRSFGRNYDIVFLSNFIHSFKRPDARKTVTKAARALTPGGYLAVKDFFIDADGTAPYFAALFSINMLTADAGDCYSREDVSAWMAAAGVTPDRYTEVGEHSGILIGRKKKR
jgi:ubiquinone/menaquinone biosynthesis C-methylase UbiE